MYDHCAQRGIPELVRLARTVSAWQAEIVAFHGTGTSNGPTEAVNLLIEKIRRVGTASATSTTSGCGSYCAAACGGRLHAPLESEPSTTLGRVEPDNDGHTAAMQRPSCVTSAAGFCTATMTT